MIPDGVKQGEKGLVIVLTGHGKGKTTSALGTVLRACGHGMKVCVIQFIKAESSSGELRALRGLAPSVEVHCGGKGFVGIKGDRYDRQTHRAGAQEAMRLAFRKVASSEYDIVVLDEINNAVTLGLVDLAQVIDLVEHKPRCVHLLLTGRDAHPDVIAHADLVTEMKEVKHPFSEGGGPLKGIDY